MTDWRKASKSFQIELLSHSKEYSDYAARALTAASENFLRKVDLFGNHIVPIYTGNLIDSIGVRILIGNRLVDYRTMVDTTYVQHATKPQHMKGLYPIWGELEIMRRIMRPSRRAGRGVAAQLMVGVPYADEVDKTHDYFSALEDEFVSDMNSAMTAIETYKTWGYKTAFDIL